EGQHPEILWIGCADSRVPANEITGTKPGEVFVHRNIANMCVHSDMNMLSVLDYAVNVLHVKHIIVAGHYGCGGVAAALSREQYGIIDNWLCHIKDVYRIHSKEIDAIQDINKRNERMVEPNVMEQGFSGWATSIVEKPWKRGVGRAVHGAAIAICSGQPINLNTTFTGKEALGRVVAYKSILVQNKSAGHPASGFSVNKKNRATKFDLV